MPLAEMNYSGSSESSNQLKIYPYSTETLTVHWPTQAQDATILRRVRRAKQVLVSVPTTEDCGTSPDCKEDLVDFVQECVDVINSNVNGYSRQTSHLTMEHIFKL